MHLVGTIAKLTRERDDFGNDQLSHTTRVGKWRVKDGNAMTSRIIEVDLVGPNTETPNNKKIFGFFQNLFIQFGFGSDTNDMHISVLR